MSANNPNEPSCIVMNSRNSVALPWGGGAYFRLIPLPLFKLGVRSILKRDNAYLFYLHPWEIDPLQPKVIEASKLYKFRHYSNLQVTYQRLKKLIQEFKQEHFFSCRQYIEDIYRINFDNS